MVKTTTTTTQKCKSIKKVAVEGPKKADTQKKRVTPPKNADKLKVVKKPAMKKVKEQAPSTSRMRQAPKNEEPTVKLMDFHIEVTDCMLTDFEIRIPSIPSEEDFKKQGFTVNPTFFLSP